MKNPAVLATSSLSPPATMMTPASLLLLLSTANPSVYAVTSVGSGFKILTRAWRLWTTGGSLFFVSVRSVLHVARSQGFLYPGNRAASILIPKMFFHDSVALLCELCLAVRCCTRFSVLFLLGFVPVNRSDLSNSITDC